MPNRESGRIRTKAPDFHGLEIAPAILYGLRMALSVCGALLVAFYLELDNPGWAAASAGIVSQPVLGASLRKGAFRVVGTCLAAVATVALTALFPQDRLGFLLGMSLWLALCTFVGGLLRHFGSYAALLAGYTMAIIVIDSIEVPDQVFLLAVTRASEIIIGVAVATIVHGLADLGSARSGLIELFADAAGAVRDRLAILIDSHSGKSRERSSFDHLAQRFALISERIDQSIGEDYELRRRSAILRAGEDGLTMASMSAAELEGILLTSQETDTNEIRTILRNEFLLGEVDSRGSWRHIRRGVSLRVRRLSTLKAASPTIKAAVDSMAYIAIGQCRMANALILLTEADYAVDPSIPPGAQPPDWLVPAWNSVGVFTGVSAVMVFWIVTAWPTGPVAILFASFVLLRISNEGGHTIAAAIAFAIGTLTTIAVTAIINFAVLPNREGFLSFSLIVGTAVWGLAVLSQVPKLRKVFGTAALLFLPTLAPTNVLALDPNTFYNSSFAALVGCCWAAFWLAVFPKVPPSMLVRHLLGGVSSDLARLPDEAGKPHATIKWYRRNLARLMAAHAIGDSGTEAQISLFAWVGGVLIRLSRFARRSQARGVLHHLGEAISKGDIELARQHLHEIDKTVTAALPSESMRRQGVVASMEAALNAMQIQNGIVP